MVQAHAPTEGKTDEEKEELYESLRVVVENVRQHDMLILMGDFSAKVGREDGIWREVMGAFGVGARNNNGQRLLEFCAEHRLSITNTGFKHKIEHKATWISPDGTARNLIDYIIVNKARRSSVLDTRVFRGCKVPSDHKLVVSKLRVKLKAHRKPVSYRRYDTNLPTSDAVRMQYQVMLR